MNLKSRYRDKIPNISVPKISDYIQTKIRMSNQSQEPIASSKALNQYFKSTDVLCTFKSRQKDKIQSKVVQKTSALIKIKIQMLNPSQGSLALSKPQTWTLRTQMFFAPQKTR